MKKFLPILICIVVLLSGCRQSVCNTDFFAMDTLMSATVYGADMTKEIEAEIKRVDDMLSLTNENSETCAFNRGDTKNLSSEFKELTIVCEEYKNRTNGAFYIGLQAVYELWQDSVPTDAQISAAKSQGKIGFGAVGKGYAASCVRKLLKQNGIESAAISLGGNVCLVGKKPSGKNWQVGIQHPKNTDKLIAKLSACDTAVVTSGGYQRYFEQDGKIYHHIIDPKTCAPAESGIISATIITPDDTLADAYSTAVYVMGVQKATELYRQNDFDMILVTDDTVYYTEGIKDSFTLCDNDFKTEIITR